eukprot:CAMPEP_0117679262 /NCGR_PEP_ID=MMETSP0804-20121206/17724_1 /TAXON_ID=1074897 /ORGANISM="Tetraselmis astigmatica, Strain CCMP880" /LENGTH=307 /DNA_ID=CAMNT_0005488679 /DNA_START=366 /DNA_END=1287 /DNA_ORIENTATION=+
MTTGKSGYQLQHSLVGHERSVSSVKLSPDATRVASSSADKTVRLWEVATGSELLVLRGHKQGVSDVVWSKKGHLLASASDDKTLILWDSSTGKQLRTLEGHTNYVFAAASTLTTTSWRAEALTKQCGCGRPGAGNAELPAHSDPITAIDFNFDGTLIVSSSFDGLCRIWDTATGQCLSTLIPTNNPPVSFVRFSPNGKYLLTCTLDNLVLLWDYRTGKKCKTFQGHQNGRFCLQAAFCQGRDKGEARVVCGSEDNNIFVWDINSMQIVQKIEGRAGKEDAGEGHCAAVVCVDANPRVGLIVSGALEE